MITCPIVGNHFRPQAAKMEILELEEGMSVRLEPEPTNIYDHNAIRVLSSREQWDGESDEAYAERIFLGFIPRDTNEEVLALMANYTVVARIEQENGTKPVILIEPDYDAEDDDQ